MRIETLVFVYFFVVRQIDLVRYNFISQQSLRAELEFNSYVSVAGFGLKSVCVRILCTERSVVYEKSRISQFVQINPLSAKRIRSRR